MSPDGQKLRIATWNVNSLNARLPLVLDWLDATKPDIALLQELKLEEPKFPAMEIEERGYNWAMAGQKSYNGVAILSKYPLEDVLRALPGDESDEQARYIEAVVSVGTQAVRVASVYVPNGQEAGSEKFAYKLAFFDRLAAHLEQLKALEESTVIGGDFNVAPQDIDVYNPTALRGTVCFHPAEQEKIRRILHSGWLDAWRAQHPEKQAFSWWDYRGNGYRFQKGLRIDHLLLSPEAADCLQTTEIEEDWRGREKASDHAAVTAELVLG